MEKVIADQLNSIREQIEQGEIDIRQTNNDLLNLLDSYQAETINQEEIDAYVDTYISFLEYTSEDIFEAQKVVNKLSNKLEKLYDKDIKFNDDLIKNLITKTLYTADSIQFSASSLISTLSNIPTYFQETIEEIHREAIVVNSEYLQFVDPSIAIDYLENAEDIYSLLKFNEHYETSKKIEIFSEQILNKDVDIDVYSEVFNRLIEDVKNIRKRDDFFDSLAFNLFKEIDKTHPLLNQITDPKKTLLLYNDYFDQNYEPNNFLEIFIEKNMLSVEDLNEVIKNSYSFQMIHCLKIAEKHNLNFDNINTALQLLSTLHEEINTEDVDDIVNALIYCGKQPSDYFNMPELDDNIRLELKSKYEEQCFSNNLKYF